MKFYSAGKTRKIEWTCAKICSNERTRLSFATATKHLKQLCGISNLVSFASSQFLLQEPTGQEESNKETEIGLQFLLFFWEVDRERTLIGC